MTYAGSAREPLVAVVTPVHNGADSLAACLESVRAQNYKHWIHLVADNASTDGTRQIAESFAASDPRVTVLSFRELLPMLENFAWRSIKQVNHSDPEFCLYQGLCLDNLVPRLREAGHATEATLLSMMEMPRSRRLAATVPRSFSD